MFVWEKIFDLYCNLFYFHPIVVFLQIWETVQINCTSLLPVDENPKWRSPDGKLFTQGELKNSMVSLTTGISRSIFHDLGGSLNVARDLSFTA